MTREEQEQAFNRRVKQNESSAVGEAALSADEQINGQSYKPGISNATNAIVTKDDEPAVSNVKQPATQSTLIDADTQQSAKENAIDRVLKERMQETGEVRRKLSSPAEAAEAQRNHLIDCRWFVCAVEYVLYQQGRTDTNKASSIYE